MTIDVGFKRPSPLCSMHGLLGMLNAVALAPLLQVTMQIKGHTDDVNAIAYLDDSNNILLSGSDDKFVKVQSRLSGPNSYRRLWVLLRTVSTPDLRAGRRQSRSPCCR